MSLILSLLFSGATLGFTIGIAPSPLLTLAISQTISRSFKEGCKVISASIIADIPLLLVTILLYSKITDLSIFLGAVSLLGGVFIAYLGYKYVSSKGININESVSQISSFKQGILTNLLNPNPYIFWFAVGGTIIVGALAENALAALSFILGFYMLMISSRVIILFAVNKSARFIRGKGYLIIMRLLGFLMLGFSIKFVFNGIKYFVK